MLSLSIFAGQDPMRPPNWARKAATPSVSMEKIKLQQILISKDRKLAVINDRVLQEGQRIAGVTVIEIEASQIRIRRGGVNKIIKLLPTTKEVNREL